MGIVTAAARQADVVIPLACRRPALASLKARGDGGLDHSALLQAGRAALRLMSAAGTAPHRFYVARRDDAPDPGQAFDPGQGW